VTAAVTLHTATSYIVRTTRNSAFPLRIRAYASPAFTSGYRSISGLTPVSKSQRILRVGRDARCPALQAPVAEDQLNRRHLDRVRHCPDHHHAAVLSQAVHQGRDRLRAGDRRQDHAGPTELLQLGRSFEDYAVGQVFRSGPLSIDEARIKAFATEFDPQPFHLDERVARDTIFGRLAASG
jgi:hypothetical protein